MKFGYTITMPAADSQYIKHKVVIIQTNAQFQDSSFIINLDNMIFLCLAVLKVEIIQTN